MLTIWPMLPKPAMEQKPTDTKKTDSENKFSLFTVPDPNPSSTNSSLDKKNKKIKNSENIDIENEEDFPSTPPPQESLLPSLSTSPKPPPFLGHFPTSLELSKLQLLDCFLAALNEKNLDVKTDLNVKNILTSFSQLEPKKQRQEIDALSNIKNNAEDPLEEKNKKNILFHLVSHLCSSVLENKKNILDKHIIILFSVLEDLPEEYIQHAVNQIIELAQTSSANKRANFIATTQLFVLLKAHSPEFIQSKILNLVFSKLNEQCTQLDSKNARDNILELFNLGNIASVSDIQLKDITTNIFFYFSHLIDIKTAISKSNQDDNNDVKVKSFEHLVSLICKFQIRQKSLSVPEENSLSNLFAFVSPQETKNIFDCFFTHKTNLLSKDIFPVILQVIQNKSSKIKNPSAIEDSNLKFMSGAYFLLKALKIYCQSQENRTVITSNKADLSKKNKYYLTLHGAKYSTFSLEKSIENAESSIFKFYKLEKNNLARKDKKEIKLAIIEEMSNLKLLYKLQKGKAFVPAATSPAGISMITLYNAFTNLGPFTTDFQAAVAPQASVDTQNAVGDGFNSLSFLLAAPFYAVFRSLSRGMVAKTNLQTRYSGQTLKALLQLLKDEDEGILRSLNSDVHKDQTLHKHFSEKFLNKAAKYLKKSERFSFLKVLYLKRTSRNKQAHTGKEYDQQKEFVSSIDAVYAFKNLLKNITAKIESRDFPKQSLYYFEELNGTLEKIKEIFISKSAENGEKNYHEAVRSLVFKHDDFRGTLFEHLLKQVLKVRMKKEGSNQDQCLRSLSAHGFQQRDGEFKVIEFLMKKWNSFTPNEKHKELNNFDKAYNYFCKTIKETNWSNRPDACLAIHDLVQIILQAIARTDTLEHEKLSLEQQYYLWNLLKLEVKKEDNGETAGLYTTRNPIKEEALAAMVAYHGQVIKRDVQLIQKVPHLSVPSAMAASIIGLSVLSTLNPSLEYCKTGVTTQSKSANIVVDIISAYLEYKKAKEVQDAQGEKDFTHRDRRLELVQNFANYIYNKEFLSLENKFFGKNMLGPTINYFKNIGILQSIFESDHGRERPLLFEIMDKFSTEEANTILDLYFNKENLNFLTNYLDMTNADEYEKFCIFLKNELHKVDSTRKAGLLFLKGFSYLISLKKEIDEELKLKEKEELNKVLLLCENEFIKTIHSAYADNNSQFKLLTRKSKTATFLHKSAFRALFGSAPWGAIHSAANTTSIMTKFGLALGTASISSPKTILAGTAILFITSGLRVVCYTASDHPTFSHTKNAEAYQFSLRVLKKIIKPKHLAATKTKFREKLKHINNIFSLKFIDAESKHMNAGNLTPSDWEKKIEETFGYDIDKRKYLNLNNNLREPHERVSQLEREMSLILNQAYNKETLLQAILRIVRLISVCNIPDENKMYFLIALFHNIYAGEGIFEILQKENSYFRKKNYLIPSFLGGGFASVGPASVIFINHNFISSLTTLTAACIQSSTATAGDVLSTLSNNLFHDSENGRTKSFQQAGKLVKNVIIAISSANKRKINSNNSSTWKSIDILLSKTVLNQQLGRISDLATIKWLRNKLKIAETES